MDIEQVLGVRKQCQYCKLHLYVCGLHTDLGHWVDRFWRANFQASLHSAHNVLYLGADLILWLDIGSVYLNVISRYSHHLFINNIPPVITILKHFSCFYGWSCLLLSSVPWVLLLSSSSSHSHTVPNPRRLLPVVSMSVCSGSKLVPQLKQPC